MNSNLRKSKKKNWWDISVHLTLDERAAIIKGLKRLLEAEAGYSLNFKDIDEDEREHIGFLLTRLEEGDHQ